MPYSTRGALSNIHTGNSPQVRNSWTLSARSTSSPGPNSKVSRCSNEVLRLTSVDLVPLETDDSNGSDIWFCSQYGLVTIKRGKVGESVNVVVEQCVWSHRTILFPGSTHDFFQVSSSEPVPEQNS